MHIQPLKFALALVLFCSAFRALADEKRFGIGFILGDPTAVSAKWYRSNERALDLQVSLNSSNYVLVYGDYLYHFTGILGQGDRFTERLSTYMGFGPLLAVGTKDDHPKGNYFDKRQDDYAFGVRIPFGVEWIWEKAPLGIGVELAPGVMIAPATKGLFQGGLTLRYYF